VKYGAMNFPVRDPAEEIPKLSSMGFHFLELTTDPPEGLPTKLLRKTGQLRKALSDCGMGLVVHLPTFVWTADLTPRIRKASLDETLEALEVAKELDAKCVVLHPGVFVGLGVFLKKESEKIAMESLEMILDRASALGVKVGLENMFPKAGWLVTPEDFLPVMDRFPSLGLTLDVAHAFIRGGLERILGFTRLLGQRIVHLHISDNWGERDDHLPIGVGRIPYGEVVRALRELGYQGWATFEVFSPDRDYLEMSLRKFEKMWEETSWEK